MKKIVIICLSLILSVVAFCGCAQDSNNVEAEGINKDAYEDVKSNDSDCEYCKYLVEEQNKVEKYKVVLSCRNGDDDIMIDAAKDEVVVLPTPKRENAIFAGWYTFTDWGQKIGEKAFFERSTVLYARWAEYREIGLNSDNYEKYLEKEIIIGKDGGSFIETGVVYKFNDNVVKDGNIDNTQVTEFRGRKFANVYHIGETMRVGGTITVGDYDFYRGILRGFVLED